MARRGRARPGGSDEPVEERILDTDVSAEMRGSFLEYAYSVIYSRALPDARDGLKPVHRRILYQMAEMGLRPDRGHVKSARVVGEVMGKLHPHGDTAIYDALVRMAQPFSLRVPLIDGHGNFGSLDAGPAAMRYTEARLDAAALSLTASLDEDVVDFRPNYDGREREPEVLPAAFPNLLVNGAAGIAVGMATNMPPHNLIEVIAAAQHLLAHPQASVEDLMRFVPGPDLPGGGRIIGLDGIREAYETGRGTFRTRATCRVEPITARRRGIIVTELPPGVGPERIRERIGELVRARKLQGVADVEDYTDNQSGTRLVIEIKSGFEPDAVLEHLYRLTPMEESFGINNVALVGGQPQTLGLRDLLRIYLAARLEVVRRRSEYRRRKAADRLHLVNGLLVAILDIDEVLQVIRTSDDTAAARERLRSVFDLSEVQADYILEMPLRRLTRFSRIELEREQTSLQATIADLDALLADPDRLRNQVSTELGEVATKFGTPRRTVLLESSGAPSPAAKVSLETPDEPCYVLLSSTGLLARMSQAYEAPSAEGRARHDLVVSVTAATTRGVVGAVTTAGRMVRLPVLDLPSLPHTAAGPNLAGGAPVSEFLELEREETVLCLATLPAERDPASAGLALGTARGTVKRVVPDYPLSTEHWPVIRLDDGDRVVGAVELSTGEEELVFISSDAQLLHFGAGAVRAQGRAAGGMAGIRLGAGAEVVFFGSLSADALDSAAVLTLAGEAGALPGLAVGTAKTTAFEEYPGKGRGSGGVRCHRFLRTEARLLLAWAGTGGPLAAGQGGEPVDLPGTPGRRDGSGTPVSLPVAAVGGAFLPPAAPDQARP